MLVLLLRLQYRYQIAVREEQQHRAVVVIVGNRFERSKVTRLGVGIGAEHTRRGELRESERTLFALVVATRQTVAGTLTGELLLLGEELQRILIGLGGDLLATELNELPLGTYERTNLLALLRAAAATADEQSDQKGRGECVKKCFHRFFLLILGKDTNLFVSLYNGTNNQTIF